MYQYFVKVQEVPSKVVWNVIRLHPLTHGGMPCAPHRLGSGDG